MNKTGVDTYVVTELGTRNSMEDRHHLYFNQAGDFLIAGVYDGHGGPYVAENASRIIPKEFVRNLGRGMDIRVSFKEAYKVASNEGHHQITGSTALTFVIKKNRLIVANTGDSRLVLINKQKKFQLTRDHRLSNKSEVERLKAYGAVIRKNRIVKGTRGINISRSLGSLDMKAIGVTEEPEVNIYQLPERFILVAATDGLWGLLPNETVKEICLEKQNAEEICHALMKAALEKSHRFNYFDNTTVMVIKKD